MTQMLAPLALTTALLAPGLALLDAAGDRVPTAPTSPQDDETVVETTYPSGALRERYEVDEDGAKDGSYERFREDGSIEVRASYRADALEGDYREYAPDGALTLEAQYRKGEKDGFYRTYAGEVVTLDARYRGDVLNGSWTKQEPDGSHVIRAKYKRGVLDGRYVEGRPAEEWERRASYDDGLLDGKASIRVDGDTVSERRWKDGRLLELDGIAPYPVPEEELAALLVEAGEQAEPDADDPLGAEREFGLARLRAYRALCGVPWRDVELDADLSALCDAAAEVLAANGALSHEPPRPPGFDEDRYREGYEGANKSNIGTGGIKRSVDGYMDDSSASNIERVGHRCWCLNPPLAKTGFGEAEGGWTAMYALDESGRSARGIDRILYPPAGYTPVDMFSPRRPWSIHPLKGSLPSKDEDLAVEVHRLDGYHMPDGAPLELDHLGISREDLGSGPCAVFRPVGLVVTPGARYRVRVSFDGGDEFELVYVVEFVATPAADGEGDGGR